MIAFKTHNYFLLSRSEIWFYNNESVSGKGYLTFACAQEVYPGKKKFIENYKTSLIDLTKDSEELFNAIHETYRYDIRQAVKKGITCQFFSVKPHQVKDISREYNAFSAKLNLKPAGLNSWISAAKNNALYCSVAYYEEKGVVKHLYLHDKDNVVLLASFHLTEEVNGRVRSEANKLLHWQDITELKNNGLKMYDWGGLNFEKLPGITDFKMKFGGTTVHRFRYAVVPGWLMFFLKIIKK